MTRRHRAQPSQVGPAQPGSHVALEAKPSVTPPRPEAPRSGTDHPACNGPRPTSFKLWRNRLNYRAPYVPRHSARRASKAPFRALAFAGKVVSNHTHPCDHASSSRARFRSSSSLRPLRT